MRADSTLLERGGLGQALKTSTHSEIIELSVLDSSKPPRSQGQGFGCYDHAGGAAPPPPSSRKPKPRVWFAQNSDPTKCDRVSVGVDPPLAHENYYNTDRGYSGSGALAHYERRQEFVEALIGRL